MFQGSYDLRRDVDKLKNKVNSDKDYVIRVSAPAFIFEDDVYSPHSITATSYSISRDVTEFYEGTLKVSSSIDGVTYTLKSSVKGHSISTSVSSDTIKFFKFELYSTDNELLDSQTVPVISSENGNAGKGYDFVYYTTNSNTTPSKPTGDVTKETGNYDEWLQSPKEIDSNHPNVYMSYRTSDENGSWSSWSTPVKYNSIGEKGEDGEGLEMVFCRTSTENGYSFNPSTLSDNIINSKEYQTTDYVPNGWSDNPQGVDSDYPYEYVCMRVKTPNSNGDGVWQKFSQPKLWSTYSEDAITIVIGNESQTIPVTSNNSLKETLTFDIPIYVYQGTDYVAATINTQYIGSYFTISSKTNPTISNNGNLRLRLTSTPPSVKGSEVIEITVNGQVFTRVFNWAVVGDGADGINGKDGSNGKDGNGEHYIYFRTTNNTAPSTPVYGSTTIISFNKGNTGASYTGSEWTEDPQGATHDYSYEWVSVRKYNGSTQSWGAFSTPSLWDIYSYDGGTGTDGTDGVHGVDGTSMSSSETLDKVNEANFDDTSIGGVNQCVASDFVADTITHLSITNYSYRDTSKTNYIEVYRQGGMVTVTYNIYVLNTISKNTYVSLGTLLPVWARPPQTIYGLNMLPDDNRIRFHSSGSVQVRISTSATTNSTNIAGVISYPANDATIIEGVSSLKETHLANYSGTSIPQGGRYRVKLYDANNNPLSETYVYFRVNGVVYKRKTHYTGTGDEDVAVANLNINLDPAKYQITTWFDGGKYTGAGVYEGMTGDYAKCELTETITVTKSSAPTVSFGGSQTNAYAQIIATGGNPLAYHTVWVAYDGVAYKHETDSSGKVYFNLSKFDTVKVSVEVPASNRSVNVTASNTFNFQSSGTYTVKLTPNRCHNQGISSRVTYDTSTFNIENVKSSNDGLYVLSNRLANNATVDGLWFRHNDNGIPSNATITKIVARLGVLNLSDTGKPLSCPITTSPLVEFREFGTSGSPFLRTASHNDNGSVTISRKDCGLVKEFTYTTSGLSYTAITGFNKDFGVLIGGRTNSGDAGYFAVDYIDVEVTYTI